MSADEHSPRESSPHADNRDAAMNDAPGAGHTAEARKRPKLDLSRALGGGATKERRRGRSMFGLLVGTLDKAKQEDKERNASDAAKKRQMIEQRLQTKLRKETDSVRRAEEAKKDKVTANRREEDLQLKDSIQKLRRTRIPILANFLSTADIIPNDADAPMEVSSKILANPTRSHPPPIFYLPAILTPAQEAFISRRKAEANEAAKTEWSKFVEERSAGVAEIASLRQRVADENVQHKGDSEDIQENKDDGPNINASPAVESRPLPSASGGDMEVDDETRTNSEESKEKEAARKAQEAVEREMKEEQMPADDDDAVEY